MYHIHCNDQYAKTIRNASVSSVSHLSWSNKGGGCEKGDEKKGGAPKTKVWGKHLLILHYQCDCLLRIYSLSKFIFHQGFFLP